VTGPNAPAGWYPNPDPNGEGMRWWDGSRWADPPAPSTAVTKSQPRLRAALVAAGLLAGLLVAAGVTAAVKNAQTPTSSGSVPQAGDQSQADPASGVDSGDPVVPDLPTATEPAYSPADQGRQRDKGWVLVSDTPQVDSYDSTVGMTARIKNANLDRESAFFTITVLHDQTTIETYRGVANNVEPGAIVTVDFGSSTLTAQQQEAAGPTALQFQTDTSVPS